MIAVSYFAAQTSAGFIQAVGWVGVAFFALCLALILRQLLRRGPTVVIDDFGVFDRRLGVGLIPWQDISAVSVAQIRSQRFISLWLRNQEEYLSRVPSWRASLGRMNERMGFSPFSMGFAGLTPGLDEVYAHIRTKVPERAGG